MTKDLGKIMAVIIGFNDRGLFGITFSLGGEGWGTAEWWPLHAIMAEQTSARLAALLKSAGRESVDGLIGAPVAATFDGGVLASWRILTEVL